MRLYRVFPYDPTAAPIDWGGALYTPSGGSNRLDNPDLYRVLYVSSHAEGAVAEKFGRIPVWDDELFKQPNGRRFALATLDLADASLLCNLNDAARLVELGLKPTDAISRDHDSSQRLARRLFQSGKWIGVTWWSYYDPKWTSAGLWDVRSISEAAPPLLLHASSQEVVDAATSIVRLIR